MVKLAGKAASKSFGMCNGVLLAITLLCGAACQPAPAPKPHRPKAGYLKPIPGKSDPIPPAIVQKGKVLIAYSDCYNCHKENERFVGPAFHDIARRYPANKQYINALAYKVISGGKGNWGYPVMTPHPELAIEDATIMVSYILSLK